MTAPITDETPLCVLQERAYTDGWRDFNIGVRDGYPKHSLRKFYEKGWDDHYGAAMLENERKAAMYAGRGTTNERTQR